MLFMATGGTVDKLPVLLPDGSFDHDSREFGQTHLFEMIERAKLTGEHTVRTLFMRDSLDITDEDRAVVSKAAQVAWENRMVITHGTDTMVQTAEFLSRNSLIAWKTIVLTGAMIPFSMGESSDALFNLGTATAFAQALPPGVYVAMNGRAFPSNNVRKDVEAGVFKALR
jgi:L-asparaginase